MLEEIFRRRHVLRRIRANPLGKEIERLADYLRRRGYCPNVLHLYSHSAEHLGTWMKRRRILTSQLDESAVPKFLDHLSKCSCPRPAPRDKKILRSSTRHLIRLLRREGRIPERRAALGSAVDREIELYDRHLAETCGLAHNTRLYRRRFVREFLARKFGRRPFDASAIKRRDVMKFVADRAAVWTRGTAKVIAGALRSYFKFLQLRGLCDTTLVFAVPTIPTWRLSSIPKALPPEDLDRFLRSFDRSTPEGRRDYAMALCMADCGLRVCEVADLRLEDVDWRQATLRVPATKTRRARLLPLTPRVGRAIAAYLRNGRPRSPERGLFLLHYAPWTSATAFTVRGALRRAYDRSGAAPWSGAHALRHTLATRMVQQGARIKEIADVLGHATIDTAFIYTKVNLPMLRRVAMPWPREERP